jgi:hypothetical protein
VLQMTMESAGFLGSGLVGRPLCEYTQYIVEGVYEFAGSRWRKRETCRHVNNRLLALLRRFIDSFRKKAGCSYSDDDRPSVIGGVDHPISINLQDMRVIFNPAGFRLYVAHDQSPSANAGKSWPIP